MKTKIITKPEEFEAAVAAGHVVRVEEPTPQVVLTRSQASNAQLLRAALEQCGGWHNLKIVEDS